MTTQRTAPWKKPKPTAKTEKTTLSEKNLKWAKARTKEAGRRYPNLVDNMAAVRRQVEQDAGKKTRASRP